jgi:DNA-binding XRE family transcriptional regulator
MANDMANGKAVRTITDYMNDETRVSPAERERINFEVAIIGKLIEAREQKGISQRELAEISGVTQPAIARLESMKATPQIDTLFKVLHPLGYTIEIVPLNDKQPSVRG